ncbi:MAG: hypothetical protein N2746_10080, partial [Deltaproteobacteria bacterium]|nr:hypothetical protein [Deltaproteobacteria bacterium]
MKSKNPFLLVGRIVLVFLFNFFVIFTNCLCNDKGTDEGGSAVVLDIQEIWDRKDVEDIVINVEVDDIVIREAGDDYVVSDTLIDTHPITDTQQVQNCEKKLSIPNFILLHPLTNGKIYIGWRLNKESDRIFYNIYRKSQHDSAFIKVNSEPITDSTNYIDGELKNGESYIYKITANLIEDNCVYEVESREHQIKYQERDDNVISYAILPKVIKPNGNCIGETIGFIKFGDVDGDLKVDYILSTDLLDQDGNRCEDIHVQMHRSDGTLLWYLNTNKGNDSAYYFQWTLFDIDGDGLAEAFGTYRNEGRHYLSLRAVS